MTTTELDQRSATGAGSKRSRDAIAELARQAAAGDQDAWNELVDCYSAMVWGITRHYRLARTDAADVFQTAWLRLVEHIEDLSEPRGLGAWLATTTRRECMRVLRTTRSQVPVGDVLLDRDAGAPEPDARLLRMERDATLRAAFSRLRRDDQELLRMFLLDPAPSYDEIAAALDMPRGSIGPTRRRCLDRLRQACELN